MIGYAVSFLLGLGVGGLYPLWRRRAAAGELHDVQKKPRRGLQMELPAAVQESVTAFGEEVAALDFNVDGPDVTPAVLKEYQAALAAYDRASAARTEPGTLTALRDGRAAMIRLDARRQGRPVPIDALPPAAAPVRPKPLTGAGERHVSTGKGDSKTEVLIDRPQPGRPALVEADITGKGNFHLQTVTRTEDLTDTGGSLILIIGEYHGRRYLAADATHLRVTTANSSNNHRWSIRIAPLSAATTLAPEHRGHGDEVLHYTGGPALLTVQFQTDHNWGVSYVCQCERYGSACRCRLPAWPEGTPGDDWPTVHGGGDGRRTLRLPRSGFLVVHDADEDGGSWYLTTKPMDIPPPSPRGRRRR